jgi:phosphoribosylformylglycinamidine synthase
VLRVPISHGEGRFYASPETLKDLESNDQVVFRYCSPDGLTGGEWNPNGSLEHIAGICNKERNVLGMMPHPERCCEDILGGEDGRLIFESVMRRSLAPAG